MSRNLIGIFSILMVLQLIACGKDNQGEALPYDHDLGRFSAQELQDTAPTELHKAVLRRSLPLVEQAVLDGTSINEKNSYGQTPLALALDSDVRARDIARYLSQLKTLDIYAKDNEGNGYLLLAAEVGYHEIIDELIFRYEKIDAFFHDHELEAIDFPNQMGERALHHAANAEVAEVLRWGWGWNNYDIHYRDNLGRTAVHTAALNQRVSVVRWAADKFCSEEWEMLRDSVFPDWVEGPLETGLTWTGEFIRQQIRFIPEGWLGFLDRLAENPINLGDHEGNTAVHFAILSQSVPTVEAALSCPFVDMSKANHKGQIPLHWACQYKNQDIFLKVLETDTKIIFFTSRVDLINHADQDGNTPLHLCALNGDPFYYQKLIEYGGNPLLANKSGQTPQALFEQRQQQIQTHGRDPLQP